MPAEGLGAQRNEAVADAHHAREHRAPGAGRNQGVPGPATLPVGSRCVRLVTGVVDAEQGWIADAEGGRTVGRDLPGPGLDDDLASVAVAGGCERGQGDERSSPGKRTCHAHLQEGVAGTTAEGRGKISMDESNTSCNTHGCVSVVKIGNREISKKKNIEKEKKDRRYKYCFENRIGPIAMIGPSWGRFLGDLR